MPIYEYQCCQCGQVFEMLQSFGAEPLKKCIHCQGKVQKLLSAPSLQFKGKGWYITDYKNQPKKKETGEKKDSAGKKNANIN